MRTLPVADRASVVLSHLGFGGGPRTTGSGEQVVVRLYQPMLGSIAGAPHRRIRRPAQRRCAG